MACSPSPEEQDTSPDMGAMDMTQRDGAMQPDASTQTQALTYHRDIAPIMATHCTGCHATGGVGPFALDSFEMVSGLKGQIAASVRSGSMPPWQPDSTCRPLEHDRRLPDTARETLLEWADGEALEGDSSDVVEVNVPEPVRLGEPDIESVPGRGYVPGAEEDDDYRCFVLEETFDKETYITGYDLVPGSDALVHHAALFLALPGSEDTLKGLEDAEPEQIGYTCFGDPGLRTVEYFGGWIPGSGAVLFPQDSAYVIPAGGKVVLQVHYNLSTAAPEPDATKVLLTTQPEPPLKSVKQQPLPDLRIVIPPGEANSSHTTMHRHKGDDAWEAIGVLPHMHLLGKKLSVTLERADQSEACLLRIEDWDFNWQESYFFKESLMIEPGDQLELNCTYDNSPENQPVIDGERGTPQEVRWGDRTVDEMCVGVVTTLVPYREPEPSVGCVGPGQQGNELGVGQACEGLSDCNGLEAGFCLTPFAPETNICSKTGCESDADCGSGAVCRMGDRGSACISTKCLDAL